MSELLANGSMISEMSKSSESEKLPYRTIKSRVESHEKYRQKKIITTSRRFEEHSVDELLAMAVMKCFEMGLDYNKNEPLFRHVFEIMHSTPNVQSKSNAKDIFAK